MSDTITNNLDDVRDRVRRGALAEADALGTLHGMWASQLMHARVEELKIARRLMVNMPDLAVAEIERRIRLINPNVGGLDAAHQ